MHLQWFSHIYIDFKLFSNKKLSALLRLFFYFFSFPPTLFSLSFFFFCRFFLSLSPRLCIHVVIGLCICRLLFLLPSLLHVPVIHPRRVDLHRRHILPQKLQVLLAHGQRRLGGLEPLLQQLNGLGDCVLQHHVGAKPQVHCGRRCDDGFGVERVVQLVVGRERSIAVLRIRLDRA